MHCIIIVIVISLKGGCSGWHYPEIKQWDWKAKGQTSRKTGRGPKTRGDNQEITGGTHQEPHGSRFLS